MYYEQVGQGPDLVFVGGLSADHTVWTIMVDMLAAHYRVLTFDNRGVGQTGAPPGPYSLAMMADDTAALLSALAIPRATLVGHSMGGAIVQQCCIAHPALVDQAIICASAVRVPLASRMHIESVIKLWEARVGYDLILETGLPWIFGENFLQDSIKVAIAMRGLLGNPHPQSLAAFKAQVAACLTDLRPLLGTITAKTLVIAGADDLLTPVKCSREIHQGISGSRLMILEACGHMIPLECPEALCDAIHNSFETACVMR